MTLTQIRTRLNTLKRKFALPLTVLRARILAEKLCLQWTAAQANRQPLPETHTLITQTAQTSRLPVTTWSALHRYLDHIRDQNATPDPRQIVQTLIPQAARPALQTLLQWELPPHLSPAAKLSAYWM